MKNLIGLTFVFVFFFAVHSFAQNNQNRANGPIGPAVVADTPTPAPLLPPTGPRPLSIHFGNGGGEHHHENRSPRGYSSAGFDDAVKAMLSRFTDFNMEGLVAAQRSAGTSQQTYIAAISATGAVAYDYEIGLTYGDTPPRTRSDYSDTGRDVGMTLLPFTVSLTEMGQYYLAFNLLSFKDMNALQNGHNHWTGGTRHYGQVAGFWKVVDQMDFLVFKVDQNFSYQKLSSRRLEYMNVEAKIDFLGSSVPSRYLAVKVGGSVGADAETIVTPDGRANYFGPFIAMGTTSTQPSYDFGILNVQSQPGFAANYGLEYHNESSRGFEIKLQTLMNMKWLRGPVLDNVRADHYNQAYLAYNQAVASGNTSATPPIDNRIVHYNHNSFYVDPSLEFSQRVSGAHAPQPVRVGLGVGGHVPVSDVIHSDGSFGRLDLAPYNNQWVKVKLFVHF